MNSQRPVRRRAERSFAAQQQQRSRRAEDDREDSQPVFD
jgi:hypothetical protein